MHIQSRCKSLEKPRIVAHQMIWREILLQLLSLSGNEGDEHKWVIPSAISAEQHKEIIVRQILHHLGLFPSDAALESKILGFFAQRTAVTVQICRSGDMAWTVGDHGSRAYKKGDCCNTGSVSVH